MENIVPNPKLLDNTTSTYVSEQLLICKQNRKQFWSLITNFGLLIALFSLAYIVLRKRMINKKRRARLFSGNKKEIEGKARAKCLKWLSKFEKKKH